MRGPERHPIRLTPLAEEGGTPRRLAIELLAAASRALDADARAVGYYLALNRAGAVHGPKP